MITTTGIIVSRATDPWMNLSAEEYMLDCARPGEMILFLWQNDCTVVIGKNQNAWKECGTDAMEKDGIKLARRLSGGGAVFHDMGNLNFTFITGKENYDLQRQAGVILEAVRMSGIDAMISGRNDLTVSDRKFSGNAFCFRRNNAFHHGTILVDTDMDQLADYLQVKPEKIISKGVESVRSRVTNLIEHNTGLTIEAMIDYLIKAFEKEYGKAGTFYENFDHMDRDVLDVLYKKHSSWEWRFGEAPKFDVELENSFPWGGLQIFLELEHGVIKSARAYSDAMNEEFAPRISETLVGSVFNSTEMAARIYGINQGAGGDFSGARDLICSDIATWLLEKGF